MNSTNLTPFDSQQPVEEKDRPNFSTDFRRFFLRGLAALMPTLITIWLMMKVWEFLWQSIGVYIILGLHRLMQASEHLGAAPPWAPPAAAWGTDALNGPWYEQIIGVVLAVILVYLVGLFAGHIIGRTAWRLAERAVMRVPLIRAIYPAVKQVTDFVLADKNNQFAGTRVVAVEPHAKGIWSIGLVTGSGIKPLSDSLSQDMITVFIPSSPTAFSGYVLVVPRNSVIELPLTVEQALRLLVSGGVIDAKELVNHQPTEIVPTEPNTGIEGATQPPQIRRLTRPGQKSGQLTPP